MANNNYAGFSYPANQYGTPGAGYSNASVSYPGVPNAAYGGGGGGSFQPAGVVGGNGSYPGGGSITAASGYGSYGPDYSRAALHPYDASKTYYQQAVSNYSTAPTISVNKTHYSAPPMKHANSIGSKALVKTVDNSGIAKQSDSATAISSAIGTFTNYDAALYSAASVYVAQKQQGQQQGQMPKTNGVGGTASNNWSMLRKGGSMGGASSNRRAKVPPRPQQLHYCEVCKISCAGPQTYREHLEGQKHKKREASLKMQASAQTTTQNRGNNYHCELCDVTCTGTDAYAAHVRGAKHQKVVKLHQKLGKPIPTDDPKKLAKITFVPATANSAATDATATSKSNTEENTETANSTAADGVEEGANVANVESTDNIKPVGGEYIEEVRDDEGKILSFNCKLCDCKFNDPNAKEMHMKGRRHRLQYKRKVQPDLVVDFKPTPRQRRLAEARAQRALMQAHRHVNNNFNDTHDSNSYWEDQRRRSQYEEEYDYNNWMARGFGNQRFGVLMGNGGPTPFYTMILDSPNIRRPESSDDRHAIARHAEIYPKEEELQVIQRIVSYTERALKFVSDALAEGNGLTSVKDTARQGGNADKDGRDNQLLSFQMDADSANARILKGVMRVGFLAKGLLLQGDNAVELVVLCSEKPTVGLLKRVAAELPNKLKLIAGDNPVNYNVEININESAVMVNDDIVSVKVSLTSPLLRESNENKKCTNNTGDTTENDKLLPREPCLRALAELRHAKWFQARATGLQSCVMVIRILRDLRQRIQSWQALPQWSLELLMEKIISSAGFPISPGDCLRRTMEALASGFLINGPGLLDPCEKEPTDALQSLSRQQREDLTVSAQLFLRYIAFRQIYKVLGMEQLPPLKFPVRSWRLNRKRRRGTNKSGQSVDCEIADADDSVSDEKIPKKDIKLANA